MSRIQKIRNVILGIIGILGAIFMMRYPDVGIYAATIVMMISLIVYGVVTLGYYATMACFMVDGQLVLIKGILILSFGLLLFTVTSVPMQYAMVYLFALHGFRGAADILGAINAGKMQAGGWQIDLVRGLFNLTISIICVAFISSAAMMVYIYGITVITASISRIIRAAKKTEMVYIY